MGSTMIVPMEIGEEGQRGAGSRIPSSLTTCFAGGDLCITSSVLACCLPENSIQEILFKFKNHLNLLNLTTSIMSEIKGKCHCGQTEWTVKLEDKAHVLW